MTDFFSKTDLNRKDAEGIISDTLNKCDDGELYLEIQRANRSCWMMTKLKVLLIALT